MSTTRYTKEMLEQAAANAESIAGVLRFLGIKQAGGTQAHISKRIKEFGIDTSHFTGRAHNKGRTARNRRNDESILCVYPEGSYRPRRTQLLRAMLNTGLDYQCVGCYNKGTWEGKSLTLDIDHIDGNWLDSRIENLRFLCPNCHSQTSTYGSKKR